MKIIHTSDLHLGKRVNEFSMIEDQKYILDRIIDIAVEAGAAAIIVAGDVYDKSLPSAEAVELFDDFLFRLSALDIKAILISGNHDSSERLSFGARLMDKRGVFIGGLNKDSSSLDKVLLDDGKIKVEVYILPFVKPAHSRYALCDEGIKTYTQAVAGELAGLPPRGDCPRILVTHQFVTGGSTCDSEELSVGGSDNVDLEVFGDFDYVALGHLHRPQNCGPKARYSGSPLKYSLSEASDSKSVTLLEVGKDSVKYDVVPLKPSKDMGMIKGSYNEVTSLDYYKDADFRWDYLQISLTDDVYIPNALDMLRTIYPNIMKVDYVNIKASAAGEELRARLWAQAQMGPLELFEDFFSKQNGKDMNPDQRLFVKDLVEEIWGEHL